MQSNGPVAEHNKRRVMYFYNTSLSDFEFSNDHPMKPMRVAMTNELVRGFKMTQKLIMKEVKQVTFSELCTYHAPDYINFLKNHKITNKSKKNDDLADEYGLGSSKSDCPVFHRMYDYIGTVAAGSLEAARSLNKSEAGIVINWMGGLHHAKKSEAYGFCYVNDIVIAVLELLKRHKRVLYVDIDCHHGDAVQNAFYTTDRVLTVSFHQYGNNFFPNTGAIDETGVGKGAAYSVNVPLAPGASDFTYQRLFKHVMNEVMNRFQPEAIVLQCGADSLGEDNIGNLNLSSFGHGECVRFLRSYNIPLMLLGGGGYNVENTAKCWAFETAVALNVEVENVIPSNIFMKKYAKKELFLHGDPKKNDCNVDTRDALLGKVLENVKGIKQFFAPSVQMRISDDGTAEPEEEEKQDNGGRIRRSLRHR